MARNARGAAENRPTMAIKDKWHGRLGVRGRFPWSVNRNEARITPGPDGDQQDQGE